MIKSNEQKQISSPPSIFHGPMNIGGIGRYVADWQRKQGAISDFITYQDHTQRYNHHFNFHVEKLGLFSELVVRFSFLFIALVKYDIFHFYSGKTLWPFGLDLPLLKIFRKKLVMTYCGTDIRLIEIEKKRNPYWELLKIGGDHPKYDRRKKWMMRWQNLWMDVFFAVRNQYASAASVIPEKKIIQNIWFLNSLDMKEFIPREFSTKSTPVLVHAPSEMKIKGTKYVEEAIEELKKRGLNFEYIRLHKIPHSKCRNILENEADIVVDQFLLGGIGNLSMEGMYFGKPVVTYVIEEVKNKFYKDCPIVNANIDNLADKLAWLIENPDIRVELGKKGRDFAEKNLDREILNERLWDVYKGM